MSEFRKFCIGALIGSALHFFMAKFGLTTEDANTHKWAALAIVMGYCGLISVAVFGGNHE